MRRALTALCALFLLTTAGVCGDDPSSAAAIVGTYTLVSVNGHALPAPFEQSTITSGSIVVNADNTFTYTENHSGSAAHVTSGTWSLSGSTYTFHPTAAGETDGTGTLSGTTLTITTTDQVLVLNKQ
jgi:hypothetical protein